MTGSIEVSEINKADIKVIKESSNYFLEIRPIKSTRTCRYKIRKISSPAKLKGRNGIIQADQQVCRFSIKDKNIERYWNETVTIDITYYFLSAKNLEGRVKLNSLKKTFNAKALLRLK